MRYLFSLERNHATTSNFFEIKSIEHSGFDMKTYTVARNTATAWPKIGKKLNGVTDALIHFKQMKTANHTGDAVVATNLLSIADDITNTAMGATCDDKNALIGATSERTVINHIVILQGIV